MTSAHTPAVSDRDAAWYALHDPATPPEHLAWIAAEHPEFAAQIARHPNAYPELVAWAVRASGVPAAVTGPPVTDARGREGQSFVRSASPPTRTAYGGLWLATFLVVVTGTTVASLAVFFTPYTYGTISPYAYLQLVGPVMMLIAVLIAAPTWARRIGGALLVLVAGVTGVPAIGMPEEFGVFAIVSYACLFLAWGLARPLRGAGYAALAVLLPLDLLVLFGFVALVQLGFVLGGDVVLGVVVFVVLFAALVPWLTVALATIWSRGSERRASVTP